jgi:hypothetical protein
VAINFRVSSLNLYHILRTKNLSRIATFADGQLTDALKHLATDSGTDPKVKKKLISVFASWHDQFRTDPSMTLVADLYRQYRPADRSRQQTADAEVEHLFTKMGVGSGIGGDVGTTAEYERRRKEKEEKELAKKKAKEAKENAKRAEEEKRQKNKTRTRRQPFDFEKVRIMPIIGGDMFTETSIMVCRRSHRY